VARSTCQRGNLRTAARRITDALGGLARPCYSVYMIAAVFGEEHIPLLCAHCTRDVLCLDEDHHGGGFKTKANIAMLFEDDYKLADIYIACFGDCDRRMKAQAPEKTNAYSNLDEWLNPSDYLRFWCALANDSAQQLISATASEKIRDILIAAAPFVMGGEPISLDVLRNASFKPGL
jgi:hypothetical protein